MHELIGALLVTGLWLAVLIGDLRLRRVAIPVLLGLLFASLLGQPWPWWFITGATILLPGRWIVSLVPLALGVGFLTNDLAIGLATALGIWAWVMKWWAGADAIVLVALTLRAGWMGLVTGLVVVLVTAIVVFLKRQQSPATLLLALNEAIRIQPRLETAVPAESELPAAAVLAAAGAALEVVRVVVNTGWIR
jgi:hypothetical protein